MAVTAGGAVEGLVEEDEEARALEAISDDRRKMDAVACSFR